MGIDMDINSYWDKRIEHDIESIKNLFHKSVEIEHSFNVTMAKIMIDGKPVAVVKDDNAEIRIVIDTMYSILLYAKDEQQRKINDVLSRMWD